MSLSKLLLSILLFLPGICAADQLLELRLNLKELESQLSCSEDFEKTLEVDYAGKSYLIKFPEFVATPIINSNVICRRFLKAWFEEQRKNGSEQVLLRLFPQPAQGSAGKFILLNQNLMEDCVRLGYCMQDVFDFFNLSSKVTECQPRQSLSDIFSRMLPRVLRPRYRVIHNLQIEIFPFRPLTEILKEQASNAPVQATFASSMTLGTSSGARLASEFRKTNSPIFLALDAGIVFATQQGPALIHYFLDHPSFSIIPITSGHEFKTIHHWKMVFNSGDDPAVLSSMNLSTPLKTPFADLAYIVREKEASEELRALLLNAFEEQCRRFSDYRCYVDFAHSDQQERRALYAMVQTSCGRFEQYLSQFPCPEPDKKYFMQPQDTDLQMLIKQLVKSAKKEIVIMTHKFTLKEIMEELLLAEKRGVNVQIYATNPARLPGLRSPDFYHFPDSKSTSRRVPDPHMKLMIIDREKMFFGTGNFTRNAFLDARELYAVTDSRSAISTVMQLASVFHHYYVPAAGNFYGLGDAEQQWLVMEKSSFAGPRKSGLPPKILYSQVPEERWLLHYRKIASEGRRRLKFCGLGHLLMVPEKDYLGCMASGAGEMP